MTTDKPAPKKRGRPKKKAVKLAEVIQLHTPDPILIEILEELLELAEAGRLTSLVATTTIDNDDEIILCGRPEQPAKSIGNLELIKAELIDCARSFDIGEG